VSVQRVHALSSVRVPHLERAVGGAADDDVSLHLGRPDAARMANQGAQALQEMGRGLVIGMGKT